MDTVFKSLKEHVYDYIAREMSEGTLKPNDKINEAKVCDILKISRTPVREALIQLASEGIINMVPRKGFYINEVTLEDAVNLYLLIGNLDGLAARLSCPLLTKDDYAEMQYYIDSMDLAINSNKFDAYVQQQRIFHEIYINKCDNSILIDTVSKLESKFISRNYSDTDTDIDLIKTNLIETNDEHRKILALLKENKALEAEQYISKVHWATNHAHYDSLTNR
ncbi:MAG: GntR family transcriptional regulator [Clostridiales bacterium]|nr:GntR family transcriptional regulator [Clostridiales bacterium]